MLVDLTYTSSCGAQKFFTFAHLRCDVPMFAKTFAGSLHRPNAMDMPLIHPLIIHLQLGLSDIRIIRYQIYIYIIIYMPISCDIRNYQNISECDNYTVTTFAQATRAGGQDSFVQSKPQPICHLGRCDAVFSDFSLLFFARLQQPYCNIAAKVSRATAALWQRSRKNMWRNAHARSQTLKAHPLPKGRRWGVQLKKSSRLASQHFCPVCWVFALTSTGW